MRFQDIYHFFENPPPIYLNKELAVCYVLAVLLRQDSYGTELIQQVADEYPAYRLSDTVLYSALKFLEGQATIDGYWQKVCGRGRPRRMYRLNADWRLQAEELAGLWHQYMGDQMGGDQTGDHEIGSGDGHRVKAVPSPMSSNALAPTCLVNPSLVPLGVRP